MIKPLLICSAALLLTLRVFAGPPDTSVTITAAKHSYQFVYNAKNARVEVKQVLNTVYTANAYQVNYPVAETYNNQVTIDDVSARVDNRNISYFKPTYTYYSVSDVFYSDEKICYFSLLLPKKGSTANVTFTETVADPRYFTSVYFSESVAVTQKEVSFTIPRWMKVELKELNFGSLNIKRSSIYDSKNDADIITYTAQKLPATQREDNGPGPTYVYPHIMVLTKSATVGGQTFTYFNTVSDQYAWYRGLVKNSGSTNEAITAKAKEITAGLSADMDKIKAVFYYVQDNIRYIAFEDGMAGFKPELADEVLRKKYGDCKGMANLTKALLGSLGYDARLCWLGTDHIAYDYQTPSLAVDNHMICGLIYKGKTIFLDATETYIGINEYAERIQGRQVLMEDGEKYILSRVPTMQPSQNYDHEMSKVAISGASLTGTVSHLWKGEDKESVLSGLNSIKKEKTDEAMAKFLSDQNSDYEVKNLKLSSVDNHDTDLTASYDLDHKNAVSSFSKAYYVDLDLKKELMNSAIKIDERKHDYWFSYKMNLFKETELALPAGYKIGSLPPNLDIVNPDYEFHIKYVVAADKLSYKKILLVKNTHLPIAKFAQWNADIEQLSKTYNESIILKPITE